MEPIHHIAIGGGSIGAIQILDAIPTDPTDLAGILKLAVQIIIGVVALVKMLQKKKQ